MDYKHTPVMINETIHYLNCHPGAVMVDCTIGGAGHAEAILKKIGPNGLLIGIDQDHDAINHATQALQSYTSNIRLFHDNFSNLPTIFFNAELPQADGMLADLGFSLNQIENSGRGFSFRKKEPLDMRMNIDTEITAETIINENSEKALIGLFRKWGEEHYAKRIAKAIVKERKINRISDSHHLAHLITGAVPASKSKSQRIHPATRVFMALRIAVNKELEHLNIFLEKALDFLKPGGRLCVISFHSLEDRMVKHHFKGLARGCTCPSDFPLCVCGRRPVVELITPKALRPSLEEIHANPMARSALLRVVEKRMVSKRR
jgi:16S rRNA (cytosine1402-N4)-methyltransferase